MTKNIYSIFDNVAQVFNKPFDSINNDTAIREFKASIVKAPHKNDYVLYHLAEFDDNDGQIKPNATPFKIFSGFDIKDDIDDLPAALREQA